MPNKKKPKVKLIGEDSNAVRILSACQRAGKQAGWGDAQVKRVMDEMMAGDYDNLLSVAQKHFDVD